MSERSDFKVVSLAGRAAQGHGPAPDQPAKAAKPAATVDPFAEFREMLAEQSERQGRLRHVQQFLNSPMFVDLREQPMLVSDLPEAIDDRRTDLDYRIRVLESVISLMIEERDSLDRVRSVHQPVLHAAE